jgi:hypothetical protein
MISDTDQESTMSPKPLSSAIRRPPPRPSISLPSARSRTGESSPHLRLGKGGEEGFEESLRVKPLLCSVERAGVIAVAAKTSEWFKSGGKFLLPGEETRRFFGV